MYGPWGLCVRACVRVLMLRRGVFYKGSRVDMQRNSSWAYGKHHHYLLPCLHTYTWVSTVQIFSQNNCSLRERERESDLSLSLSLSTFITLISSLLFYSMSSSSSQRNSRLQYMCEYRCSALMDD